jgi:hypothetical protein
MRLRSIRIPTDSLWDRERRDADIKRKEQAKYSRQHEFELDRRLEKLSLICRAMWTLIQDRANLSEKELLGRTTEIDLLDGKADGRVSVPARECATCKKTIAPRHDRCLYCGGKKLMDSVFESV